MKPKDYQVGSPDPDGYIVDIILGKSATAVVYSTKEGHLRWGYGEVKDKIPAALLPARGRFELLMLRIKTSGLTDEEKESVYHLLGKSLFQVLDSGDATIADASFKPVEDFLAGRGYHPISGSAGKRLQIPAFWKKLSRATRLGAGLVVFLVGCSLWALLDAWLASKVSPQFILQEGKPGISELVVVVHGYRGGPESMREVLRTIRDERPNADILFFQYPTRHFGNADPFRLAARLEEAIATRNDERHYSRVTLVGHSMGALLVRKAYVYGCGLVEDAPLADGAAQTRRAVHEWATKVERIVLLAGVNRGWSADYRPTEMPFWDRALMNFGLRIAKLTGTAKCIRSFERGEPFVANLRLQWLAAMEQAKAGEAGLRRPEVVQLLGDQDDLVSKEDSRDVSVAQDFLWVNVNDTGHSTILQLSNEGNGLERKRKIQKAFGTEADLAELRRFSPTLASETDTNVTTVVFVLHGIRDMGDWTSQFKKPLEEGFAARYPGTTEKIYVHPAAYGYFPMGPFLIWGDRQKNVRWFMDQVTELKARFPRLKHIHFIGHSNGTYVLASAIEKYLTLKVDRVVFAGSVVRRDFPWSKFTGRVKRVRNYVSSADWVVGFFPRLFELPGLSFINPDLGSAGYNGFEDGFVKNWETQFVRGGHGAALNPLNVQSIADFILDEKLTTVPSLMVTAHPGLLDLCSRLCWVIWIALLTTLIFLGWLVTVTFNGRLFAWLTPQSGKSIGRIRAALLACLKLVSNAPFKLDPKFRGRAACAAYCGIILYLMNTV